MPITQSYRKLQTDYQVLLHRYPFIPALLFFVAGFLFDIATLGRIDDLITIIQQAVLLALVALLLSLELIYQAKPIALPRLVDKLWGYRDEAVHFLFGSLLSAYMIFYFVSSSIFTSLAFIVFISALLVANEFPHFRALGHRVKFALFGLCLVSYFAYLVPILWGSIGVLPFSVALILAMLCIFGWYILLGKYIPNGRNLLGTVVFPAAFVQLLFLVLYLLAVMPPVPLSLQYIGIYHNVKRVGDAYELSHERPWWKFWQKGDQTFYARPGDKIHLFTRVFSPAKFQGQVFLRWSHKDPRQGWISWDAIPLPIVGGRDEGFRGVGVKANYTEGRWRVQVETEDEREIGRIYFNVTIPTDLSEREFQIDRQ